MDAIVYRVLWVRYLCVYGRVDWGLGCWVMGCVVPSCFWLFWLLFLLLSCVCASVSNVLMELK